MRRAILAVIALSTLVLPAIARADAADVAQVDGALFFQDYCAACHGVDAMGMGPMRPALRVPTPDLTLLAERNGGAFPHFDVIRKIDGRDPLVSHGSDMPVWGNFFEGEAGAVRTQSGQPILTTAPIAALVEWLESVQR